MAKKFNDNLFKLVNLLSDRAYHDGNTLGEQLKITRTAVWKLIKKLIQYGIKIDSIKGKGYCLTESLFLLSTEKIEPPYPLIIFESVDSTNEYLKSQKNIQTPIFCLAEQQTQGKGRLNRYWYSPFAKNIYLSCRYPFKKDISELAGLSLLVALSIVQTLKHWGLNKKLHVKWPNDVYYDNQKLAGILVEIQSESYDCITHAIIGIGINVNTIEDKEKIISQPWTSLATILGHEIDRNKLCSSLILRLITDIEQFKKDGLKSFMDEWMNVDWLMHKNIILKSASEEWQGIVQGITLQGQLLLQLPRGGVRAFSSGEVTIAKTF